MSQHPFRFITLIASAWLWRWLGDAPWSPFSGNRVSQSVFVDVCLCGNKLYPLKTLLVLTEASASPSSLFSLYLWTLVLQTSRTVCYQMKYIYSLYSDSGTVCIEFVYTVCTYKHKLLLIYLKMTSAQLSIDIWVTNVKTLFINSEPFCLDCFLKASSVSTEELRLARKLDSHCPRV